MKFDWYQATVEEPPLWLQCALADRTEGEWVRSAPRMRNGYAYGLDLMAGDEDPLMHMCYGGSQPHPLLISSSDPADRAASIIREVVPRHLVSRADVCEDLEAPDFFDRAFGVMRDMALQAKGPKPDQQGDWITEKGGRTFYLGSKTSVTSARLYEKGKQMLKMGGPAAKGLYPEEWCRLEVQVRPAKREAKLRAAEMPALEWWGASRWSQQLADQLLGVDAPRVPMGTVYSKPAELERAAHNLVLQYGPTLDRLLHSTGSAAALGEYLVSLRHSIRNRQ